MLTRLREVFLKKNSRNRWQFCERNYCTVEVTYDHFSDFHNLLLFPVFPLQVLLVLIGRVLKGSQVQIQQKSVLKYYRYAPHPDIIFLDPLVRDTDP